MMTDEENKRLMNELSDRITDICRDYSIDQVTAATFTILMGAIEENDVASERLHTMNTIIYEVQHQYNVLLHQTKRPEKTSLH